MLTNGWAEAKVLADILFKGSCFRVMDKMQERRSLDDLDLALLAEMQADGRKPVSHLARKLGISRAYAAKRLDLLLDKQVASIAAFTSPFALGYRTLALTGIETSLADLNSVADRLRAMPEVKLAGIVAGWKPIVIWTMFANPGDLPLFLSRELGRIPGIRSTETMMIIEWRAAVPYLSAERSWRTVFSLEQASATANPNGPGVKSAPSLQSKEQPGREIDHLDLVMLQELEKDGRQSLSKLAEKLGISKTRAGIRLQNLLSRRITDIVALPNPLSLGYHAFAMIGVTVSPGQIEEVMARLQASPDAYLIARVVGRYDVIVWMMFPGPTDLSHFLAGEMGSIPGILSVETAIDLEARKVSFTRLALSCRRTQ